MLMRSDWPDDAFEQLWAVYPRRVAKKAAMKALDKVRKSGECPFEVLLSAVKFYARSVVGKEMKFVAHPATWLNGGRWEDDENALLNIKIAPSQPRAEISAAQQEHRRMQLELERQQRERQKASEAEMRAKYPQWFK